MIQSRARTNSKAAAAGDTVPRMIATARRSAATSAMNAALACDTVRTSATLSALLALLAAPMTRERRADCASEAPIASVCATAAVDGAEPTAVAPTGDRPVIHQALVTCRRTAFV